MRPRPCPPRYLAFGFVLFIPSFKPRRKKSQCPSGLYSLVVRSIGHGLSESSLVPGTHDTVAHQVKFEINITSSRVPWRDAFHTYRADTTRALIHSIYNTKTNHKGVHLLPSNIILKMLAQDRFFIMPLNLRAAPTMGSPAYMS